ncbi:MAG: metallophosphoesterase [Muribaculaceae bacterium]|nr:metallophosphoesterase [Muribaculaceae bacterium]
MRLPLLPILIIIIVNIITDYVIYKQIVKSGTYRWLKYVHLALSSLLFLMIMLVVIIPKKAVSNAILVDIMWVIYCYFSVYIPKYIYLLFCAFANIPRLFKCKKIKVVYYSGVIVSIILFFTIWWSALVTRNSIDINQVKVSFSDLPGGFNGYKIAQISDLHVGSFGSDTTYLHKVVNAINDLHPDLILFTGDIVNRQTSELLPFINTLSQLHAVDGVYSVLGNHDYGDYNKWKSELEKIENLQLMYDLQRQMGWTLLSNDYRSIYHSGDSIAVIGVENWGEPPFSRYGDLKSSYVNLNDSVFKILLSHNPSHWENEVVPFSNIHLTLSGHTHAMQILFKIGNLRMSPAKMRYKYWGGLYGSDKQKLYVNIGIGEVGIPARFGATPEVTLFTLVGSND